MDGIPKRVKWRHKVDRLRNMVRKLEVDELEGTGVIVNGARSIIEERLERLLKSETEVMLDHEYNSNKNIGLSQEGGTCAYIFNIISNRKIKTEHDPTGLGRWTSFKIRGK